MLLRRDLLVAALTLGLAAAIYAISFRDLASTDQELSETDAGYVVQLFAKAPISISGFVG